VDLPFGTPPGVYEIKATQDTTQTIDADGQSQSLTQKAMFESTVTVFEPDEDGGMRGYLRYDRVRMDVNGMVFDTDQAPPRAMGMGTDAQKVHSVLKALTDAVIVLHMDHMGRVVEVEGVEDLWQKVGAQEGMRKAFSAEQIKMMANRQFELAPGHPVGVGAIWHPDLAFRNPLLGETRQQAELELVDISEGSDGNRVATIKQTSYITGEEGDSLDHGVGEVTVQSLDLEQTGTIKINLTREYVSIIDQTTSGTVKMEINIQGETREAEVELTRKDKTETRRVGPPPEIQPPTEHTRSVD
jgi:hypothetical protein